MKCKRCKRQIEDNSIFCNWCGARQIAEAGQIKVPPPKRNGRAYFNQVTVDGERTYVSAATEEEYYAKARAAKAKLIEVQKSRPKNPLGAVIDRFVKENSEILSASTINAYKSYRRTRFQAYMEQDATQINYQKMVNDEARNVKPKTVHNAWRLVTAALAHAEIPAPKVNLPKKPKAERQWLDYEQITKFLSILKGKPYELGAILALHGLRRSELLHLTADDIDVEKQVIHVRGASVVAEGNKLIDKETNKNRTSTRDVHIVIPRLGELVKGKEGRLVTTNPTTLYGSINGLCERNGLPNVGVHGLRHSYISLCFHLKWDMQTVMREGGYSNMQTVNEVYRHLAAADANADVERARAFFASSAKPCTESNASAITTPKTTV